jgi:hypothetical protein
MSNIISLTERLQKQKLQKSSNKKAPSDFAEELIKELELRDSILVQAFERIEELERRQAATLKILRLLSEN